MPPLVSVIVPVLHEPGLPQVIESLLAELDRIEVPFEVIVVDDGIAETGTSRAEVRVIDGNARGKGAAVRQGLLEAVGEVVLVVDADVGVLFPRIPLFVDLVRSSGYDVAIAERVKDFHARHPARFFLSYGLYLAQRLFVFHSTRFADTQCGFKAFSRSAARAIARRQTIDGGMYDIEYLYIATLHRMKIAQVAVGAVAEIRESRIDLLRCLRRDPAALVAIKLRRLIGGYR